MQGLKMTAFFSFHNQSVDFYVAVLADMFLVNQTNNKCIDAYSVRTN